MGLEEGMQLFGGTKQIKRPAEMIDSSVMVNTRLHDKVASPS
jgi:hypothetical protein